MAEKIRLSSSAGTGFFYTLYLPDKKKRVGKSKLTRKKYDPVVRKHVDFVEEKLK